MLTFRLPQLTASIELVTEISRQLNERKNEAVAEITSTFDELERALHQRKTSLITDLELICSTKQKVGVCHISDPRGRSRIILLALILPLGSSSCQRGSAPLTSLR